MYTVLSLFLAVTACAATQAAFIAVEYSDTSPLTLFMLDPFEQPIGYSLVYSDVGDRILERFGEPESTDIAYEVDRYGADGSYNRISTLHYPGLTIQFGDRAGTGNQNVWLNWIELTGTQYRLKHDLGIGANHQDVLVALQLERINDSLDTLTVRKEVWEKRFAEDPDNDTQVGTSVRLAFEFDASGQVEKITWDYGGH